MTQGSSFLQQLPLFAGLSATDRATVEQRMRRREFVPQAVIVRQGSADDPAFFILSGRVAVRRQDAGSGIEFTVAELGDGQMFGEMALLTRKPRSATVVALEPTTCAVLEQAAFETMLRDQPSLALAMMAVLAERLDETDRRVGVDFVNLSRVKIDPRVLTLLPQPLLNEHRVIPIAFCNNRLTLAMTNPNNVIAFDDVRRLVRGVMIEPAIITEDDFRRFMASSYAQLVAKPDAALQPAGVPAAPRADEGAAAKSGALASASIDLLQSDLIRELQLAADTQDDAADVKQDLMSASEDAPIVRLANSILGLAIKQGASDIHIEPMEGDVTVRFRIDGVLQSSRSCPSACSSASRRD